jgi:hypothetical protein
MERLHMEPIILTLPEELGRYYRSEEDSLLSADTPCNKLIE